MERGDSAWSTPDHAIYRYEWYNGMWFGVRAIRSHSHKYCFNPAVVDEYYDLQADPAEMNNLAANTPSHPAMTPLQLSLLARFDETKDTLLHAKLKAYLAASPTT